MPFVASATATQPVGEPSVVTVEDTSTGSDGDITTRRVYLRQADGSFLVPDGVDTYYTPFPLGSDTIDIDALDKDYCLDVIVEWLDTNGDVLYDDTLEAQGFTSYNEDFDYGLTQQLTGNPLLFNDNKFFQEKSNLRTYIDSGDQAAERATDIYGAQQCYDLATNLRLNSQYYFNINS